MRTCCIHMAAGRYTHLAVFLTAHMTHYHLYAIGNALVDSEYDVSDERLAQMGVSKRHMTLIDEAQRSALLAQVQDLRPRRTGGGSAGNTVVALSQLGGRGFYSCRVADDELGAFYRDDLQAQGVASNLQHTQLHPGQTGTCLVLVTPDAERTMCTYLGATAALDPSALHPQDIARSQVYYMEGYLASSPTGLQAALQGLDLARQSGVRTALTLSDVSMIHFCRDGLQAMLGDGVALLLGSGAGVLPGCCTDRHSVSASFMYSARAITTSSASSISNNVFFLRRERRIASMSGICASRLKPTRAQ